MWLLAFMWCYFSFEVWAALLNLWKDLIKTEVCSLWTNGKSPPFSRLIICMWIFFCQIYIFSLKFPLYIVSICTVINMLSKTLSKIKLVQKCKLENISKALTQNVYVPLKQFLVGNYLLVSNLCVHAQTCRLSAYTTFQENPSRKGQHLTSDRDPEPVHLCSGSADEKWYKYRMWWVWIHSPCFAARLYGMKQNLQ